MAAGTGRLRRAAAGLVDAGKGTKLRLAVRGPGQEPADAGRQRPVARRHPQVRLAGRPGRPDADARGAGGAGQAQGAAGAGARPVGAGRRRGDPGRPRLLEDEGGGDRPRCGSVVQMALGAAKAAGGLAFDGRQATGWVGDLLGQLEGGGGVRGAAAARAASTATLRPYQARGYSWLASCAAGASAPAWPTTWAWARRSRPWRCSSATGQRDRPSASRRC